MSRRRRLAVIVLAGGLSALLAAAVHLSGALGPLERDSVRTRFALRHVTKAPEIVVVGIDNDSFARLHAHWPFARSLHARAVDRLRAAGAKVIVYDVQFTEPTTPDQDNALYDALGRARGAILATSQSDGHGHTNVLGGDANLRAIGARAGAADLANDANGVVTHYPYAVRGLPSLPVLAAARAGSAATRPSAFSQGRAWIDYRGPPGTFVTFPFWQLVQGAVPASALRGRIVVVGATAPTLQDEHATPAGGSSDLMTGPEVQANAIWTALHGNPLRSAPAWLWVLATLVAALAAPAAALGRRSVRAGAATVALPLTYLLLTQLAFASGTILVVVTPVLAWALGLVAAVIAVYLMEGARRHELSLYARLLERKVDRRTEQLWASQLEVLQRLAQAAESRDSDTGEHIERMGKLCERLALEHGMSAPEAYRLRVASALHDVGKIGIPDRVLLKPARLDPGEWAIMKTHTSLGADILSGSQSGLIRLAETIARTHHERWDGSGYPLGLRGEEIPLAGRICALCDVFDALLSRRPYKEPWPFDAALGEIERSSGTHFDPQLTPVFVAMIRRSAAVAVDMAGRPDAPDPLGLGGLGVPRSHEDREALLFS